MMGNHSFFHIKEHKQLFRQHVQSKPKGSDIWLNMESDINIVSVINGAGLHVINEPAHSNSIN